MYTKTWDVWDFPDNLYILLDEKTHKEFFSSMFEKFGGKRPYARFLNISQMQLKQYWRRYSKKDGRKYVQYIPLWLFKKSCKTSMLKRKIERGVDKIRVRAGEPIINPKFPIKESPELYRIIGHMIGDGCAPEHKSPYYSNKSKILRKQFKKDLGIFGKVKVYERKQTVPIVCFPKTTTDILLYIFKLQFTKPNKIPKEILTASDNCKSAFLQALFDDEGTVSTSLAIGMKSGEIINGIKTLLESIGIETTRVYMKQNRSYGNYYMLSVKTKSIKEFRNKINFLHKEKYKKLETKIKIIDRNVNARTRPLEWTRNEILNLLKNKPRTTMELCEKILLSVSGLHHHLKYLEKERYIKNIGLKNKFLWKLQGYGRVHEIQ